MILLELALKGVVGYTTPLVRFQFQPGLNVLRLPDEGMRAALLDVFFNTIFPDRERREATAGLVASGASESRALLSFTGGRGEPMRLLRELASGSSTVYRQDQQSGRFTALSSSALEISQMLRVQENLPDDAAYERLYTLSADSMPSTGTHVRCRAGVDWGGASAGIGPVAPGMPMGPVAQHSLPASHAAPVASLGAPPGSLGAPPGSLGPPIGLGAPPGLLSAAPGLLGPPSGGLQSAFELFESGDSFDVQGGLHRPASALGAPVGQPGDVEQWSPVLTEEKWALYSQLREALEKAAGAAQARAELEKLRAKQAALLPKAKKVRELEAELEDIRAEIDEDKIIDTLPADAVERLYRLETTEKRYKADLKRLDTERTDAQADYEQYHVPPLSQDKYVIGGLSVSIVSIGVALALGKPPIALLNIVGSLVAVGGFFRYIGDVEQLGRKKVKFEAIIGAQDRLDKQHELETGVVRRMLAEVDLSRDALLERVQGAKGRQAALDEAIITLQETRASAGGDTRPEALAALQQQIDVLRQQVDEGAAASRLGSMETMQARLQRLERELTNHGVPVRPSDLEFPDDRPTVVEDDGDGYGDGYGTSGSAKKPPDRGGSMFAPSARGADIGESGLHASSGAHPVGYGGGVGNYSGGGFGGGRDRSRSLMQTAMDVLHVPLDALVGQIQGRFGQYLSALTDEVYGSGTFDGSGAALVAPEADIPPTPYNQLEPRLMDLVDAALRLTLVEVCAVSVKAPIIIDDPFGYFDQRRREMFGQMLGYLAAETQVVVLTSQADLPGTPVNVLV